MNTVNTDTKNAKHSAQADQVKGRSKEVVGTVKEKVGSAIGDHKLEAKGHMQHTEGTRDRLKGEIKEKIETVKETVAATVGVAKEKLAQHRK